MGAQKAGTSWWSTLIRKHPRVVVNGPKELYYFSRFWREAFDERDADRYQTYFARPEGFKVGEWTARYMADFWTPPLLSRAAPDALLMVILRDPVERYLSALTHDLSRAAPLDPIIASVAFDRGLYARQLEHLMRHFDAARILVLQYERCVLSPASELNKTFEFLGLDSFKPTSFHPVNKTARPKPRIDDAARAALVEAYEADVLALVALTDQIDVDLWPSFSHLARRVPA